MKRERLHRAGAICCAALLVAWPLAGRADAGQRLWRLHEFTRVEIVAREAGSPENAPPAQMQADALRQQLALVQYSGRNGKQALFANDELSELVPPLVQALGRAGPGEDVLLLSSARREGGVLAAPTAITARLFVQADGLQMVVHDARFDFYDAYRGTQAAPRFVFGSRSAAGPAAIAASGAVNRRADWVSLPLQALAPPPRAQAKEMPAARVPATAPPAAGADDIERRLETLKRLRDRQLISEDEYRQKRQELLQRL